MRLPLPPAPIVPLIAALPQYPHARMFCTFLNVALAEQLRPEALAPLRGKHVCIRIKDVGIALHFTVTARGFAPLRADGGPDLAISARADDFLALALRKEDPDTLFFTRRLVMEGDTELGLFVKNTLDALELPPLDLSLLSPRRVVATAAARLRVALG